MKQPRSLKRGRTNTQQWEVSNLGVIIAEPAPLLLMRRYGHRVTPSCPAKSAKGTKRTTRVAALDPKGHGQELIECAVV
jgi:hypothetical protein